MKPHKFGTFANELLLADGEYGLVIWLGTDNESEANELADELMEVWNQNTLPEMKQ